VLIAGAIVAIALATTSGGGGIHAATVVTVTAPAETTASSSKSGASENSHLPSPSAKSSHAITSGSSGLNLVSYHGAITSAEIPAGWSMLEDETQKSGYVESKWRNPANPNDSVLIDSSPATSLTLEQDAAPVHNALLNASGYQELSYGPGDLNGVASWMWVFRISGDQRIDYFFNRCTGGYGVLGSTVQGQFNQLRATFRSVAQSVQATCR
jgi:hypothetical protein